MTDASAKALRFGGRSVGYVALLAITAIGLLYIFRFFSGGHEQTAVTQHVPWGLWVAGYVFFLGLSAGSFLLSTLVYVFGVKRFATIAPFALILALGCLVLGGLLILFDLGHPARVYLVLFSFNPSSVMAWMGMFYNVYIIVVLIELFYAFRAPMARAMAEGRGPVKLYRLLTFGKTQLDDASIKHDHARLKLLGIIGIPVAIIVHGGVGSIFAVAKARPEWFGGLLPVMFLLSAIASGAALLTFTVATLGRMPADRKRDLVRSLARLTIGLMALELLFIISEVFTTLYGGVPANAAGWHEQLFGPYWYVFWGVQIFLGILIPSALVFARRTANSVFALGSAGLLVIVGMVGTRLNIVIPAQITPTFKGLAEAYSSPRFAVGYLPNALEWWVVLGVAALGVWGVILAFRFLPLGLAGDATASGGSEATSEGGDVA